MSVIEKIPSVKCGGIVVLMHGEICFRYFATATEIVLDSKFILMVSGEPER